MDYRKKRITASRDHIANGVRNSASNCPLALAVREATGSKAVVVDKAGAIYVEGLACIGFDEKDESLVRLFVQAFDQGLNVAPFEFSCQIPVSR